MSKRFITAGVASALLLCGGGYSIHAEAVSFQQTADACTGTIVDSAGDGVIGATVRVKDSSKATATDLDGHFSIAGVKPGSVLEISCIGYTSTEVVWNGQPLSITLQDATKALDELVVVGYGVQKKANVTGSVSSMTASAIEDRAVASVSAAMAGEMPGVVVVQSSGAPGSQTGSITIRGNNSINSASPLVIVDGVPGSMNNIDPQEIASISVLKDAASAAIYGVQAANGVILITTKNGKLNTAPKISYSGSVTWAKPTTKLDPVNARDYTIAMREALKNVDPDADVSTYDTRLKQYADGTLDPEGTDWWGETFRTWSPETSHTVQINGGSANTTYMASLGYLYQEGMLKQNSYNRYNGRINLNTQLRPWLAFGMNTSFYRGILRDGYKGVTGIVLNANRLNATMPIYRYDEQGNITGFAAPGGYQNPVAQRDNATGHMEEKADQLFANIFLNITPIEGLTIKPLFSWRHDYTDYYAYRNILYYDGTYNTGDNGTRSGTHQYANWDWMTYQMTANYLKTFAEKHNTGFLVGYEAVRHQQRASSLDRTGGGDNALWHVLNSLSTNGMTNSDSGYDLNRASWFGRVTYDYDSRYLFEANFRADASSRFPKKNRWGYFPAVSAAWRISQENFMADTGAWLNDLKLRLGWGRTGNEELGGDYYPSVATYGYYNGLIGGNIVSEMYESRYVNDELKWASVTNWELGLDAAFLNNMFVFEGSVYKRKTNDMLLNLPILSVIGVGAPAQNAGSVENKGVDLSLTYNHRLNKDWSWNATLNVGYNHNEITNLAGTEGRNPYNWAVWYLEGYPIGSYYGLKADGLFKNQAEVDAGPLRTGNEKPGDVRYKDWAHYEVIDGEQKVVKGGDGIVDNADRMVIGKMNPSWTGGLNIGVNFRNFDFSMLWQGAFDYNRYLDGEATMAFYNNGTICNWMMEDRWTPENPNGTYPRLYPNSASSPSMDGECYNSFWCEDASYVRLKNLTLGYTLPTSVSGRIGLDKIRVYFNGENLLTFSKLFDKGIDPEAPQGRGAYYANVVKLSFGLKVTL